MWETFIVNPLTNLLLWIYQVVGHNFGLAIVIFTILIRLVTHPLMAQQIKGSQGMQEMQKSKKWQDIQKKYKDDKEKLAQEQMALYKELGINPFGTCLPTLVQLPIIFGLYQAIIRALAASPMQLLNLTRSMYSFFHIAEIIPLNSKFLWMNLGQPERLTLPFLPGVWIPLLAIVVAVTSYFQQKLITPPAANPNDQSATMTKMMAIYMPLLMGYFAMTFASGLAIYFIAGNLVGIAQYAMLGKLDWKNLLPGKKTGEVKKK